MLDRHRLGVVGQQIRRRAADHAQRPVQARGQAAQGLVPRRQHHPEPRPRQPAAEQLRAAGRRSAGPRPSPTAATSPAPGSTAGKSAGARPARPPSPRRPPAASCAPTRRSPSRPACGAPHPRGSCRCCGSTSSSTLARNASIDRGPPLSRQRICPRLAQRHIPRHGLAVSPGQLRRRMGAAGQVKCLENLHDLPARLGHGPSGTMGEKQTPRTHPSRRDHTHQDTPARREIS